MIKLQQVQIDALKMMIQIARTTGMDVDIKVSRPDIISKSIQISTGNDDDMIDEVLGGEYLEAPHVDLNNYRSLSSLFDWTCCYHADMNGWICLFNDANTSEDGRWFMKVTSELPDYPDPAMTLYRHESSNLVKIITFRKRGSDILINSEINNPDDDFVQMPGCESINAGDGFINYLNRSIGIYSGLVMDVLNSVITKIVKASE